jgi:hypothetical protein
MPSFGAKLYTWCTLYTCRDCRQSWRVCVRSSCTIDSHKNVFYTRRQCRDHARYWHSPVTILQPTLYADDVREEETSDELSLSNNADVDAITFEDPPVESPDLTHYCFACLPMDQFANWCIHGSVAKAVSWLVHQALVQEPIRFDASALAEIPPHAVQLFLNIAKLLMTTGQIQHNVLSVILDLLMGLLTPQQQDWPTMPRTMAGFQSHILNPTNKHALIAQLPIPQSYMLADNSHSFCCLHEIAAFGLLLPPSVFPDPVPLRLQELCRSVKIRDFLAEPIDPTTPCLVSVGLIFWLDGWDPSASSKNNRSPVHTASATLLFIRPDVPYCVWPRQGKSQCCV